MKEVEAKGYSAVKKGERLFVSLARKRDSSKSEDKQRAEMILEYLTTHSKVATIVKKGLS